MPKTRFTPILKDTYLSVIKGAVGSSMFRHNFFRVGSAKRDLAEDGRLSCAFFVSGVLKMFDLISRLHLTVQGTVADLEQSGWRPIRRPRPGAVLLWVEEVGHDGLSHAHLGFFLGPGLAVSNNSRRRRPVIHHPTFRRRRLTSIFWHPRLD